MLEGLGSLPGLEYYVRAGKECYDETRRMGVMKAVIKTVTCGYLAVLTVKQWASIVDDLTGTSDLGSEFSENMFKIVVLGNALSVAYSLHGRAVKIQTRTLGIDDRPSPRKLMDQWKV